MENKNALLDKSKSLALLIIKHCRNISEVKKEYILTRQLMKSGTSIGANIREAKYAESKNDFIHKYKISLKEANETEY
ncbi:MAG: four helix bundle protein, partial [Chitinophagales bacterium]